MHQYPHQRYYQVRPVSIQPIVLNRQTGDVNGDKIPDQVYLIGNSHPNSPFIDNITLMVQDGSTNRTYMVPLRVNLGYQPTIFLGDFTGDGVSDILIQIDSGGSGGYTTDYLFSFLNNQARKLFDSEEYNKQFTYHVAYRDGYRVEVTSNPPGKTYILDISYKGTEYLSEIYNRNGKLKAPLEGEVIALGGLYPIDLDRDGVYELMAFQRIIGRYNADTLGHVINLLKWNGSQMAPFQQWVAISH